VGELERELADFKAQDTERGLVLILGNVQFAPDHETLTAEAMRKLYPLVTMLREQSKRDIRIKGHTDSSGEKGYNLDLSQRRADCGTGLSDREWHWRGADHRTRRGRGKGRRVE